MVDLCSPPGWPEAPHADQPFFWHWRAPSYIGVNLDCGVWCTRLDGGSTYLAGARQVDERAHVVFYAISAPPVVHTPHVVGFAVDAWEARGRVAFEAALPTTRAQREAMLGDADAIPACCVQTDGRSATLSVCAAPTAKATVGEQQLAVDIVVQGAYQPVTLHGERVHIARARGAWAYTYTRAHGALVAGAVVDASGGLFVVMYKFRAPARDVNAREYVFALADRVGEATKQLPPPPCADALITVRGGDDAPNLHYNFATRALYFEDAPADDNARGVPLGWGVWGVVAAVMFCAQRFLARAA